MTTETKVEWRIYYTDGSRFDSNDGDPEDAPCWGIGAISQLDEDSGRAGVAGVDYYWWEIGNHPTDPDGGCWSGGDLCGMQDHFGHFPRLRTALKFARTLARATDWRRLQEEVIKDPDFPSLSRPFHAAYVTPPSRRGTWR
jgi:hypothetical protein